MAIQFKGFKSIFVFDGLVCVLACNLGNNEIKVASIKLQDNKRQISSPSLRD